ncbi:MAG: Imm74 family immunity protein [Methylocella sp.]
MTRRGGPHIVLTEGAIRVHWGERILTILPAPALQNVEERADFVVDMDQILNFDPPHEADEVSVEQLQAIAQAIEEEFDRLGLVVAFE